MNIFFFRSVVEGQLQTNPDELSEFVLPTVEEREAEKTKPLALEDIHQRIKTIITILSDFSKRRDPSRYTNSHLFKYDFSSRFVCFLQESIRIHERSQARFV